MRRPGAGNWTGNVESNPFLSESRRGGSESGAVTSALQYMKKNTLFLACVQVGRRGEGVSHGAQRARGRGGGGESGVVTDGGQRRADLDLHR